MTAGGGTAQAWYRRPHWQIIVSMIVAFAAAIVLRGSPAAAPDAALFGAVDFVGDVFLRLLKMMIVPLLFVTIVTGIASLDVARLGRIGVRTMAFYLTTSAIAVLTGMVLVQVIRPGDGVPRPTCVSDAECDARFACVDGGCVPTVEPTPVGEVFRNIVPNNPFGALAAEFNMLGVIFFALLFGIALSIEGERATPVRQLFEAADRVISRMTGWVLRLAPLGIAALVFVTVVELGASVVRDLAKYMLTVIVGLGIHGAIVLPALAFLLARVNPIRLFEAFGPALLTAFSTASSNATLPVTIECAEKRAGVDKQTSGFVIPVGATVNMDGTALYEAVAAIFIAQAFGMDLSFADQVTIFVTASLAAIGAAGVPSAGLVMMVIVLDAVGLPLQGIGMLLAVDRILDMCRTTVNVWGDCVASVVVAAGEKKLDRAMLDGAGRSR